EPEVPVEDARLEEVAELAAVDRCGADTEVLDGAVRRGQGAEVQLLLEIAVLGERRASEEGPVRLASCDGGDGQGEDGGRAEDPPSTPAFEVPRSSAHALSFVASVEARDECGPVEVRCATFAPIGARPRAMLRVLSSMEAQAISGLKNLNETVEGSLDGLVAKLGVEDLADEAVKRDGIEAHVRRDDYPRVDDLPLRQLLQDALEVILRVALLAADLQVLALERHARGVAEAEDAGHEPPVHQLGLAEDLAVG